MPMTARCAADEPAPLASSSVQNSRNRRQPRSTPQRSIHAVPYSNAAAASAMTLAEFTMSSITTYSSG
jgi:hypothetical protein